MNDSEYSTVVEQARGRTLIDQRLQAWIAECDSEDALGGTGESGCVAPAIFDIADIMADAIYSKLDIATVDDSELGPIRVQAALPRFENPPGAIWRSAPLSEKTTIWYSRTGSGFLPGKWSAGGRTGLFDCRPSTRSLMPGEI